jgi:RNase P subunit RPR2
MGCCRGNRSAPPARSYDDPLCSNCRENLQPVFAATAAHQTRGQHGSATILVRVNCPKCNAVNTYRMSVVRQIKR